MERYYQPEIECAPREQIKALQDERLVRQVRHVWDNVPYYRRKMEAKGVTPDDIKSSDDLWKRPFLSKADLREAYPYGLMGKPLKDCVRIQSTSGTTASGWWPSIPSTTSTCGRTVAPGPLWRRGAPTRTCVR